MNCSALECSPVKIRGVFPTSLSCHPPPTIGQVEWALEDLLLVDLRLVDLCLVGLRLVGVRMAL
jgi:hypothetical protein